MNRYPEPHQLLSKFVVPEASAPGYYVISINNKPFLVALTLIEATVAFMNIQNRLLNILAEDARVKCRELEITYEVRGDIAHPDGRETIIHRQALGAIRALNGIRRVTYTIHGVKVPYGRMMAMTNDGKLPD